MTGKKRVLNCKPLNVLNCLNKYSEEDIIYRLQNYRKMMVIRDPMLRLFSAYNNKLAHSDPANRIYVKNLRHEILNITNEQIKRGDTNVTFRQFTNFLARRRGERRLNTDVHTTEYYQKCWPCMVDYDLYIRIETGHSDQRYFMDEYLHLKDANILHRNKFGNTSDEQRSVANGYIHVQSAYTSVDPGDYEMLHNRWSVDSMLFGYSQTLNESGLVSVCGLTPGPGAEQCC